MTADFRFSITDPWLIRPYPPTLASWFRMNGGKTPTLIPHPLFLLSWVEKNTQGKWSSSFADNLHDALSIDEPSLSSVALYTIVINNTPKGKKVALVAMVRGTMADKITDVLQQTPERKRLKVREVSVDMAAPLHAVVSGVFPMHTGSSTVFMCNNWPMMSSRMCELRCDGRQSRQRMMPLNAQKMKREPIDRKCCLMATPLSNCSFEADIFSSNTLDFRQKKKKNVPSCSLIVIPNWKKHTGWPSIWVIFTWNARQRNKDSSNLHAGINRSKLLLTLRLTR